MSLGSIKIERILDKSIIAIVNAGEDPEILAELARFSYDKERLNDGLKLHTRLGKLCKKKKRKVADQLKAGEELRQVLEEAQKQYMTFRKVSWVALRQFPALLKILAMSGRAKRDLFGWMEETRQFYINARANTEIMEKLAGFGVTDEGLEQGLIMVDKVEKSAAHHEMLKGKAIQATKERDTSFREFMAWFGDFKNICRTALADFPQRLEKLGIKVPS